MSVLLLWNWASFLWASRYLFSSVLTVFLYDCSLVLFRMSFGVFAMSIMLKASVRPSFSFIEPE